MSKEQAQNKYNELMTYLMDNNKNANPIYKSYDDFFMTNGRPHQENINKFERALNYFQGQDVGRGKKPQLSTYITQMSDDSTEELDPEEVKEIKNLDFSESEEDNKIDNLNSKSDFLNIKMSEDPYQKIKEEFKIGTGKPVTKQTFKNPDFAKKYKTAMDAFGNNFVKNDLAIGYNSKYIKPDYLDSVFLPRHQGWTVNYEDIDKDGHDDVRIFDDENRLRVFNGYYFNDDNDKDLFRDHLKEDKNNTYKTFLDYKFNEKNKVRAAKGLQPLVRGGNKAHKDHVKSFVKWLHNIIKPEVRKMNRHNQMVFDSLGFDSKVASAVERYMVLPFILSKIGKFNQEKIHAIVYEDDKKSVAYKLRMAILRSKEIKDLYKSHAEAIEQALHAIMEQIGNLLLAKDPNTGATVTNETAAQNFILAFMKKTWDIPNTFYNYAMSA